MQNFQHCQCLGHFLKPLVPIHHLDMPMTRTRIVELQLWLRMPALAATVLPPKNCFISMKTIFMVKPLIEQNISIHIRPPFSTSLAQCQFARLWNHPPGCFHPDLPDLPLLAFLPPENLFVLLSKPLTCLCFDLAHQCHVERSRR